MSAVTPASPSPSIRTLRGGVSQDYTETALRELYQQVNSMPDSAKKKKLIRQVPSAPTGTAERAKRTAADLALLFLHSLRSSRCRRGLLTLGRRSAGSTGVHAHWEELLR